MLSIKKCKIWKQNTSIYYFIGFIIIYIILIHNLEFSKMWAFGDLSAYPTDINIVKNWIIYIWRNEGLGVYNYNVAFWYYVIVFLMSLVFGNLIAQKIIFLSLIPISYISCYVFLTKYLKLKQYSAFFGALLYAINPVTVSEFVGGAVGQLAVHSIFPLFILYAYRYIFSGIRKYLFISIIFAIFLWNPYVTFWYVIIIILTPIIIFELFGFKFINNLNIRKAVSRIVIMLLLVMILYSPIIFTVVIKHENVEKRTMSIISTMKYTYGDISFLNLIRIVGNKGSAQAKEFLNYNSINFYTLFGYTFSILFLIPIFFRKLHRKKIALMYISYILFFISVGILLLLKSYPKFVKLNPLLYTLRNPIKILYPIVFLFSFICSLGVDIILNLIRDKKIRYSLIMLLSIIILIYNYPTIDGTFGLEKVRNDNYYIDEKYYNLKYVFKSIENNTERANYRILFLPWEYPMCLRIRSEFPNYLGTPLGAGLLNIDILYIKDIYNSIAINFSKKSEYLQILNTKYVVIDKTFKSYYEGSKWYDRLKSKQVFVFYSHNAYWISGNPLYFYNMFITDPNFKLVYENKDFAIFENRLLQNDTIILLYSSKNNETIEQLFQVKEKPAEIISYKKINPTLWEVQVNATKPFMLSFPESYDPLWEARIYKDEKLIKKVKSVPLYEVINGFYIDERGKLDIKIRYKPQDWFEMGLAISALTFIGCIGYLFYDWRRNQEKGDMRIMYNLGL